MAWELEGLISGLITVISCSGEQGCTLTALVGAINGAISSTSNAPQYNLAGSTDGQVDLSITRATNTVWRWLAERRDVSVGPDRKYNDLSLDNLIATLWPRTQPADATSSGHVLASNSADDVRIRVSEETMWESITGHGIDFKRLPRSEWLLLLGIASCKTDGILQGDLGRLVEQDKRSVPKRTDALFKKGYIVKSTVLVKRTKTSKLWLRLFAPPAMKQVDGSDEAADPMNLSKEALANNLDPVPWHARWTGETLDYKALITTIVATVKEWGVMRLQDLKAKLGVLGKPWHMKVTSKACRFLNARGAIQYVAASLDDRKIFKDCVRFVRDLTTQDWDSFLSTGPKRSKQSRLLGSGLDEAQDTQDQVTSLQASSSVLAALPTWSPDEPLTSYVIRTIQIFGESGLTNPDVYSLTIGPNFSRYLSSMTSILATSVSQPLHLKHLQLRSEHARAGKVASYRYFVTPQRSKSLQQERKEDSHKTEKSSLSTAYGFTTIPAATKISTKALKLGALCRPGLMKKPRGRPKSNQGVISVESEPRLNPDATLNGDDDTPSSPKHAMEHNGRERTLLPELVVEQEGRLGDESSKRPDSDTVAELAVTSPPTRDQDSENVDRHGDQAAQQGQEASDSPAAEELEVSHEGKSVSIEPQVETANESDQAGLGSGRGRGRGRGAGRGRGRGVSRGRGRGRGRPRTSNPTKEQPSSSSARQWVCENCGGSWKNDIGLKYHLEKSRTSCNPSYDPAKEAAEKLSKKLAKRELEQSQIPTPKGPEASLLTADDNNEEVTEVPDLPPRRKPKPKTISTERVEVSPIKAPGSRRLHPRKPNQAAVPSAEPTTGTILLMNGADGLLSVSDVWQDKKTVPPFWEAESNTRDHSQPLPVAHNHVTSTAQKVSSTLELETEGLRAAERGGSNDLQPGQRSQPTEETTTKSSLPRKERKKIVSSMVAKLLAENQGVYPGGESLWRSVAFLWSTERTQEPSPLRREFEADLKGMLGRFEILEHWHAFRAANGTFSKCHLITNPDMDAFSPQCRQLVDAMKESFPEPYIPTHLPSLRDIDPEMDVDVRSTRRALPNEVSVLAAPVYAAQIAAKRKLEEEGDDRRSSKRKRASSVAETPTIRFAQDDLSLQNIDPSLWLYDPYVDVAGGGMPGHPPLTAIHNESALQFLDPNTFLEEEPPGYSLNDMTDVGKKLRGPMRGNSRGRSRARAGGRPRSRAGGRPRGRPPGRPSGRPPGRPKSSESQLPNLAYTATFAPHVCLRASINGTWLPLTAKYFEEANSSFTCRGWMPDEEWLQWGSIIEAIDKRASSRRDRHSYPILGSVESQQYHRFINKLKACASVEQSWTEQFTRARPLAAGPHNIFIRFSGDRLPSSGYQQISWPGGEQLTGRDMVSDDDYSDSELSVSSASSSETGIPPNAHIHGTRRGRPFGVISRPMQQFICKSIPLTRRRLTTLPQKSSGIDNRGSRNKRIEEIEDPEEIITAVIVVRVLLGGVDRSIDWGLLLHIYPDIELDSLRKFWFDVRNSRASYITKFSQDFQDKFIASYAAGEISAPDFDSPLDYDWLSLIQWARDIPSQTGFQLPSSRNQLDSRFTVVEVQQGDEDWSEKFFHVQSSTYGRFEAIASEPGALIIPPSSHPREQHSKKKKEEISMAKSWIRSLCCSRDTQFSPQDVKMKLMELCHQDHGEGPEVLQEAVNQLVQQKIIHKSKRPPLGGRPYRLTEWVTSNYVKLAHRSKFVEAIAFKADLDAAFSRGDAFKVPYTITDGSVMALMNMNAHGRVKLVPHGLPNVPLGFEPGNYESRKYPKSHYHFELQVKPTETYQYNEGVEALTEVMRQGIPLKGSRGELPQWGDIFGGYDLERWCNILGAFCFALSTRGPMSIEGICHGLRPVLEHFEAEMIINWGLKIGIIRDHSNGKGATVGEWWWLAVPWQLSQGVTVTAQMAGTRLPVT